MIYYGRPCVGSFFAWIVGSVLCSRVHLALNDYSLSSHTRQ